MPRKIARRNSAIHGNGVFALTNIPANTRVVEYRGTRITHAQADRKYDGSLDSGHTFLFTLNDKYIVDANEGGNFARWINFSCDPNCESEILVDINGDEKKDRVMINSLREIAAGEELTYDYGITLDVPHTKRLKQLWACRCGSPDCRGTMLSPKRPTPRGASKKAASQG